MILDSDFISEKEKKFHIKAKRNTSPQMFMTAYSQWGLFIILVEMIIGKI